LATYLFCHICGKQPQHSGQPIWAHYFWAFYTKTAFPMSNNRRLYAALLGFFLSVFTLTAQVVDTVPPLLKCKQGQHLSVCNPWGGFITIWATDFVESLQDDHSNAGDILLGVRKKCTGEGFPTDKNRLLFQMSELGIAGVELWAKDAAGNTSICEATIQLIDNAGYCDPVTVGEAFFAKDTSRMNNTLVKIEVWGCQGDSFSISLLSPNHIWGGGGLSHPGDLLWATASKSDNPLNGVSTYDLSLIVKHILGLEKLSAPQIIAADANRDGKVTMYDVVLLRNLILGIIDELPGGVSWRFWPYEYEFPDPANPFSPPFPERIEVPRSADPVPSRFMFFGVKIGDVDFSANPK
jgi:hypothetical protein